MGKVRKVSVSRSGLKTSNLDINHNTIAVVIPSNIEDAQKFKTAYEKHLKKQGLNIKYQKDIHYKRPFWKFWTMNDYSLAVYKF